MTAPDPLREDEVEAVAEELWRVSAEPEHGDSFDGVGAWRENFRIHARAAILRLDQVREGRGK
jgi:hypothetical protein